MGFKIQSPILMQTNWRAKIHIIMTWNYFNKNNTLLLCPNLMFQKGLLSHSIPNDETIFSPKINVKLINELMLSVPSAGKEQKRSRIFWSRDQHTPQTITTTAFPKYFNYIIIFIISLAFIADLFSVKLTHFS